MPDPGVAKVKGRTALLINVPQNDSLNLEGVAWEVIGKNVTAINTVESIETLLKAAKANDMSVFISQHYYYPNDHGWKFEVAFETLMQSVDVFDRRDAFNVSAFGEFGADWEAQHKLYIQDGKTIVSSPRNVHGPETNDLELQLRKNGINKVILADMSANLFVESQMRELPEQGFEVAVVDRYCFVAELMAVLFGLIVCFTFSLNTPYAELTCAIRQSSG